MEYQIITIINWVRGLTMFDWLMAGCIALLALGMWSLVGAPIVEGLHRRTWL